MEEPTTYDVIVLGAGLAGLGAARALSAFGLRPLIVEARDRIGGRAHTKEFAALPELGLQASPVEEGCNYLHGCGEGHALFVLARQLGIPTAVCPSDLGGRYGGWESQEVCEWRDPDCGGELISIQEVMDAYFLFNHTLQGIACVAPQHADPGTTDAADSQEAPDSQEFTSLHDSFEEALGSILRLRAAAGRRGDVALTARERGLLYSMRGRLLGYVAPAARMPSSPLVADMGGRAYCEAEFRDPHWPSDSLSESIESAVRRKLAIVKCLGKSGPRAEVAHSGRGEDRLLLGDGFRAVVEALARGLDVLYGDVARLVEQTSEGVVVSLTSGRTLHAAYAVVALPVGVLSGLDERSAVEFRPPLPAEKLGAIRNLSLPHRGASTHEKVVLRWEPSAPFVEEVLGAPGGALQLGTTDRRFHFLNLHKYGRTGQLLCHIWADAEWRQHAELSDAEVVAEVVAALRAMYPGRAAGAADASSPEAGPLVSEPRQFEVTRWAEDPFALGAYSELQRLGASEADRQRYARTEGRVLFAGEGAVPADAGAQCTHGALLSGVSAALETLFLLHTAESEEQPSPSSFPATMLLDEEGPLGLDVPRVVDVLLGASQAMPQMERKRKRQ